MSPDEGFSISAAAGNTHSHVVIMQCDNETCKLSYQILPSVITVSETDVSPNKMKLFLVASSTILKHLHVRFYTES